uniref:StAR related lipid transfer domain containing 8 n=1 Tax=Zonotrichia albicollis TaxID=44394 RepID=A0A8D2N7K6_ZONAL
MEHGLGVRALGCGLCSQGVAAAGRVLRPVLCSLTEAEAKEACDWLRAAGFPQYAQLYEESLFPLDISAVKKDHSFLDQDSLKSLCRRLMTLNTCASMKLDVHFQRKQNEDSEEEVDFAISTRWSYQRDSKRWSRVGSADAVSQGSGALSCTMHPVSSRESILTDLSTNPEATSLHSTGSVGSVGGMLGTAAVPSQPLSPLRATATTSSCSQSEGSAPEQPSGQGETSKEKLKKRRSRSFLKRIESLRRKDKEKASPDGRVAPHSSATLPPGWATRTNSSKRGTPAPFHGKKHFFSVSYRTNRLLGPGGTKGSSDPKRGGIYLEDYDTDTAPAPSGAWAAAECQRRARHGDCFSLINNECKRSLRCASIPRGSPQQSYGWCRALWLSSPSLAVLEGVVAVTMKEWRAVGVSSAGNVPCVPRKLRWHSFQNSHRPSLNSASLEINRQSSAQLNLLQKCSLLRLTAIMEKYSVPHKQAWTWTVPKFMKRSKVPDYRDKMVFGVPPIVNVQRTGQPLPQSIQQAMRYLRSQCLDQVGIFRKSGVKSRIQALRHMNETSPEHVDYSGQSAYDVADLLKQYFRDLPEPIFTSKLTDTFLQIYQFVSKEQRLQAVQAAIILMPDENREVLQTLLYFLSDIASAEENQMTAGNLAVCLAPSIFHLNVSKKESTSPRAIHKRGTMGKPDQKDLNENMAATQGLSHMIVDCKKLFQVSHDILLQLSSSYMAADAYPHPLADLVCQGESKDLHSYFEQSVQNLLKESTEKFKGWLSTPGPLNTELSCKKVGDGNPLRLWKVCTDVEAPPATVLHRVLRERHLWDEDLLQSRVVEALDKDMEVYHYVTDSMAPHPRRDCMVLRRWRTDLPRGACLLSSLSVEHDKVPVEGGVKAIVLTSQYLIEPGAMGRSRVTHICRADLRGRSPEWYNKVFGHLCAMELVRIRDSFPALSPVGPETKI